MKKIISTTLAGVFLGTTMLLPVTPAMADRKRDNYVEQYYKKHPNANGHREWRDNRRGWRDDDYRRWYRNHHDNDNDQLAAGLFGFTAGAILGGAIAGSAGNAGSAHVQRCVATYRSYDPGTDTYVGYDGFRHECRL